MTKLSQDIISQIVHIPTNMSNPEVQCIMNTCNKISFEEIDLTSLLNDICD